ncbi:hypothetical protein RHSIM_Rhsim05G0165600 [Rhododendron simsii]|uniref:Acyl carrier protein n=1 Tax=Rhododendron simsii TaxID=118357 RepID=A0A834GWR1_RHOSS|nr:hypothetical protein RHSIM_Rhsim05G0165600 [Rhododendron simsii]
MAARMALLKHLRVSVVRSAPQNPNFNTPFSSLGNLLQRRRFSDEVRGSFLDKSEVTDRVVTVVKNFQKVDPSKVINELHYAGELVVNLVGWKRLVELVILEILHFISAAKLLSYTSGISNIGDFFERMVTPNAHFQNDLGLDSLDAVEVVMALEEEFGFEIPDNEADKINSISLAVDFISSHPQAK